MYKSTEEVEERIELNYQAVKCIESLIDNQTCIEDKLELISLSGMFYSEYVTGVYASDILEEKLFEIGNTIEFTPNKVPNANKHLIVMTKAGNIGGHSVIVNNWISWDKNIKYSIVFTDFVIEYVPTFLVEAVKTSGGNLFFLQGSYIEKAKQLLDISQNFSKIILLQHMYDIVPNVAYSNSKMTIPIMLYNHSNFKFSFGYTVADKILNILEYDVNKTINCRGVDEKNSLLLQFPNGGMVVEELTPKKQKLMHRKEIFDKYGVDYNKKLVISMGEGFKFRDIVDCSFITFVKKLVLEREDVQYLIIGPNPNEIRWKELEDFTGGKAKAVGHLNRKEVDTLIGVSDLYITSFPMAAAGSNIAEKHDVPYLYMSITGRGSEMYGDNVVTTVEELFNKSNQILAGNREKYKGSYFEKILNQEQWCNEWHKIVDNIAVHKGQQIKPKRIVQTEEIVNCQLMQAQANGSLKNLLAGVKLTSETLKVLIDISEKYQLDCIPKHFVITRWEDKPLLQHKKNLLKYTNKWLSLSLKGYRISDYFEERKIRSIAIYGSGQIGFNLLEALKDTNIEVECFIDRSANMLNAPIKIIDLNQVPISRTIVTTPWIEEATLRRDYVCLTDEYEVISLFDIIDSIEAQVSK